MSQVFTSLDLAERKAAKKNSGAGSESHLTAKAFGSFLGLQRRKQCFDCLLLTLAAKQRFYCSPVQITYFGSRCPEGAGGSRCAPASRSSVLPDKADFSVPSVWWAGRAFLTKGGTNGADTLFRLTFAVGDAEGRGMVKAGREPFFPASASRTARAVLNPGRPSAALSEIMSQNSHETSQVHDSESHFWSLQ